jgi:hypothetical protein
MALIFNDQNTSEISEYELTVSGISPQVKTLSISALHLSSRAANRLKSAGITTIGVLLESNQADLKKIPWLGATTLKEIETTLKDFLLKSNSLSDSDIDIIQDPRPSIIAIEDLQSINLIDLIVPLTQELLKRLNYKHDFEVLKRRYGLQNSKIYTLQEIGDYYDITRERVRQIEERSIKRVGDALIGIYQSKEWRLPKELTQEVQDFHGLLKSKCDLLQEKEIIRIFQDRYKIRIPNKDMGATRLLLSSLGFELLSDSISGFFGNLAFCWMVGKIDKPKLFQTVKTLHNLLIRSPAPISFFEIKVDIKRKLKGKFDDNYIQFAVIYCDDIEQTSNEEYQIKFIHLQSLADRAYRILYETKEPLSLKSIVRQINHRLATAGLTPNTQIRSLQNQLVADSRFESVGRSGTWKLSDWKDVNTKTLIDLIQTLFHVEQKGLTVNEIYDHIKTIRPNVLKNSIVATLSFRNDLFTRVSETDYELAEWGKASYIPKVRNDQQLTEAKIKVIFTEWKGDTMPLNELAKRLVDETGFNSKSVYQRIYFSKSVDLKDDPNKKGRG